MSSRSQTALARPTHDGKLHPSVSPELARAFDGFFGPPARELRQNAGAAQDNRAHTPCEAAESRSSLPVYSVVGRY